VQRSRGETDDEDRNRRHAEVETGRNDNKVADLAIASQNPKARRKSSIVFGSGFGNGLGIPARP